MRDPFCARLAGYAMTVAVLLPITALAGFRSPPCDAPGIPSRYDGEIRQAARRYLPAPYRDHHCGLKAQYWVESRLEPKAISPAGAAGVAQIMPATFKELKALEDIPGGRFVARTSIRLGALHLSRQIQYWAAPRSAECRLELAWASYNAGAGSITRAQVESGGRRCWDGIAPHLHRVTGAHAAETIAYVSRIWAAWRRLRGWIL